jgi:hypothetical protein
MAQVSLVLLPRFPSKLQQRYIAFSMYVISKEADNKKPRQKQAREAG